MRCPLHPEEVRHAVALEDRKRLPRRLVGAVVWPPHADDESVTGEVPHAQLVRVVGRVEDPHARHVEPHRLLDRHVLDGHPLNGDRSGVFQAGVADRARGHRKEGGDALRGLERRDAPLLDRDVRVASLAGRLVERNFLDTEIVRARLDRATDAGKVLGKIEVRVDCPLPSCEASIDADGKAT